MKSVQNLSFKINTHHSSKSKNDRHFHGDKVDRQMERRAKAQFRHMKVSLASADWE